MNSTLGPLPKLSLSPPTATRAQVRGLAGLRWGLLVAALSLALIGIATVHSATAELPQGYAARQAVWVGIGMVMLLVVLAFDYHVLLDLAPVLYGVGIVALVLVLFFGEVRGGARSWLGIGGLGGQPSEFVKIATVLLLARYLALSNRPTQGLREIAVCAAIVGAPMILIALEPDYGGAALFVPTVAAMLLIAGVRWKTLLGLVVLGLILGAGVVQFGLRDYQRQRILTYFSPTEDPQGAGYQVRQSKIAVGSGQLTGRGYMQGTQSQLRFLPERHTDFIFAVLAEEWGFLGVIVCFALFALYFSSAIGVAVRARDRAGILLVVGLLAGFATYVLYNTAMVVGLVPITGVPLPFLSYGGSFTFENFLATGIMLGVDLRRHANR